MDRYLESERGMASIIALLMTGMLLLIGLAAMTSSDDEVHIAGNQLQEMRAFYAAEAGLEQAAAGLQRQYDSTGLPPTEMPEGSGELNNCDMSFYVLDDGPIEERPLSTGSLSGLNAQVKSFTTNAVGVSGADHAKVVISQTFETALVPIFQFVVFYDNDLEIAPGPAMTLNGRVHSNGDLWLQANNSLNLDSYVTSAGKIWHGRKGPGSVGSGDVLIKDASASFASMREGGPWLDAGDSDWYDKSAARWGGRVQDEAHGQRALNVPVTNSGNPHKLIERADGNPDSYEN
ncbi:MAG: PilX N-terminal domain-containing pilus assembly protein, partial [candidate division Zixibacteria bacterium]